MRKTLILLAAAYSLIYTTISVADETGLSAKLESAMDGNHRSEKNIARNQYRHPVETLTFFGLEKDMSVIEIAPGGGWYTEILAPVLRGAGAYIAGSYDVNVEGQPKYRYRQHASLLKNIEEKPDVYGEVKVASYSPPESRNLWEKTSVDMVLTFRNSHGWTRSGLIEDIYSDFFTVLKPGGVLGVVQHRAPENDDAKAWAKKGYVSEARIIAAATQAGFELEAKSEINANPKDLKDHEEGVWRLPPTLSLKDQDREKYLAIGESDRMTLKFRKPM